MARTKNRPETAPSATHAAPDHALAPSTAPAPDSPAAAVRAALAASPGSTVAAIADAAGTGKPATREALLAMEKAGAATRNKGGKPGIPDTWTLADRKAHDASPTADREHHQDTQPAGDPDGSPGGPGDDEPAGEATQDETAETASPEQHHADADGSTEAEASITPGSGTGQAGPHDDAASAGDNREDAAPDEHDDKAAPSGAQDADANGDPREGDAAPADSDGEASDAPDPALVTDLAGRLDQVRAAADAAGLVLAASGDLKTALAGLDEIAEQAAQARRLLKAAIGGRKAPAARPGGLRDKVLAHLHAHPDKEFTPHEIHKVLSHSSGAIANALDTLVKLGEAEVATEKPRRFRRAAKPAGTAPGTDSADSTERAGAA